MWKRIFPAPPVLVAIRRAGVGSCVADRGEKDQRVSPTSHGVTILSCTNVPSHSGLGSHRSLARAIAADRHMAARVPNVHAIVVMTRALLPFSLPEIVLQPPPAT